MTKSNRPRKTAYDLKVVEEDLTSDQATCPKGYPGRASPASEKTWGANARAKPNRAS